MDYYRIFLINLISAKIEQKLQKLHQKVEKKAKLQSGESEQEEGKEGDPPKEESKEETQPAQEGEQNTEQQETPKNQEESKEVLQEEVRALEGDIGLLGVILVKLLEVLTILSTNLDCCARIGILGGIQLATKVLQTDSPSQGGQNAAILLSNLSIDSENKKALLSSEALDELIKIMSDGSASHPLAPYALGALMNLQTGASEYHETLVSKGVTQKLASFLEQKKENSLVNFRAESCLLNICNLEMTFGTLGNTNPKEWAKVWQNVDGLLVGTRKISCLQDAKNVSFNMREQIEEKAVSQILKRNSLGGSRKSELSRQTSITKKRRETSPPMTPRNLLPTTV